MSSIMECAITAKEQQHFSCDLIQEAKNHVAFLQALHSSGITTQKLTVESLRRYSKLWLPLIHHHYKSLNHMDDKNESTSKKGLIPPKDIAWLWHCHRLAPYRYAQHIEKMFLGKGKDNSHEEESKSLASQPTRDLLVLDPEFPFTFQLPNNTKNETFDKPKHDSSAHYTKRLWEELYPTEAFFVEQEQKENDNCMEEFGKDLHLSGFYLLESCERQATFLWQVSQINLDDNEFLLQGVENYYKFVSLMKKGDKRPRFLVPTYQIDLMWHTHILNSIRMYHKDCMKITGLILEHDDSLTDRNEGGVLDTNFKATKSLWFNVYKQDYKVPGGMYRGEPPKQFFSPEWVSSNDLKRRHDERTISLLKNCVETEDWEGIIHHYGVNDQGASSTGRDEDSKLMWMSIDDYNAFKAAQPKSTVKGVNSNEKQEGYVFGKGVKGVGYYNLNTRESYQIILERIKAKKKKADANSCLAMFCIVLIVCAPCGFVMRKGSKETSQAMDDLHKLTTLRMNAAGPSNDIDIPDELLGRVRKYAKKNGADSGSAVYDSTAFYTGDYISSGAGCGAGGDDGGGGCGGGACGAGACGGGGCGAGGGGGDGGDGGGGCGGGGCGGGGCGGGGCGG